MKRVEFAICALLFAGSAAICSAGDLHLGTEDLRIERETDVPAGTAPGFHLYIRKKPDINSVLLTETTKDPTGTEANYAFRAKTLNPINGNELRMLNGAPLTSQYAKYSIIDSTPEPDAEFGQAFHLYIPSEIEFGYPWTRNGTVKIARGTFINIRAFGARYGDYTDGFADNPFMFDLGQPKKAENTPAEKTENKVVLTEKYSPEAAASFSDIARFAGGSVTYSDGPETIVDDIMRSLASINPKETVDVVFALDTTGSMKDDIQQLRSELIPRLTETLADFGSLRLGLLLYRDYGDNYRTDGLPVKYFPFTQDIGQFMKALNSFTIYGTEGGDVPEAVYEALYASMDFYPWNPAAQRKIILIGDAEAHPVPRGTKKYTRELVEATALARDIVIDAVITPDGKTARDRK